MIHLNNKNLNNMLDSLVILALVFYGFGFWFYNLNF